MGKIWKLPSPTLGFYFPGGNPCSAVECSWVTVCASSSMRGRQTPFGLGPQDWLFFTGPPCSLGDALAPGLNPIPTWSSPGIPAGGRCS